MAWKPTEPENSRKDRGVLIYETEDSTLGTASTGMFWFLVVRDPVERTFEHSSDPSCGRRNGGIDGDSGNLALLRRQIFEMLSRRYLIPHYLRSSLSCTHMEANMSE